CVLALLIGLELSVTDPQPARWFGGGMIVLALLSVAASGLSPCLPYMGVVALGALFMFLGTSGRAPALWRDGLLAWHSGLVGVAILSVLSWVAERQLLARQVPRWGERLPRIYVTASCLLMVGTVLMVSLDTLSRCMAPAAHPALSLIVRSEG